MNITVASGVQFCYEGLNSSCTHVTYPLSLRIPLYLFFTSTIIVIVWGNLFVMITIIHFKHFHTPTNYLIFSMSVADLLLGLIVMPPNMVESLEKCWYFGDFLCKFHAGVDITLCNASVLHLTFISIDRFCAISQPLQYQNRMTNCVVLAMISVSWMFSAIFGFAVIFSPVSDTDHSNESVDVNCIGGCLGLHEKEIGVSYFFIFYLIPLTVMSSIYLRIFVIAIRQAHAIFEANKVRSGKHTQTITDYKATKTLGIVIGVFLCCWTPFFICNIIDPIIGHNIPTLLYEILMWIAYLNSMFNPIIYAFLHTWFRKGFENILKSLFK